MNFFEFKNQDIQRHLKTGGKFSEENEEDKKLFFLESIRK